MGHNRWSTSDYTETVKKLDDAGVTAKTYTASARAVGKGTHEDLDPKLKGPRISANPIIDGESKDVTSVVFAIDITGSGGENPGLIRDDLPQFMGLVTMDGYLEQCAVQVMGFGDARYDRYPLQASQFEPDIKIEENLRNLFIEGGGGGGIQESYELMLWYATYMNKLADWERGQRGFLFIIGDELPYPDVRSTDIAMHVGSLPLGQYPTNMTLQQLMPEVLAKYHTYYIICKGSAHYNNERVLSEWRDLLGGEHVISLEDARDISELAASIVGTVGAGASFGKVKRDLTTLGMTANTANTVEKALVAAGMSITSREGSTRVKRL